MIKTISGQIRAKAALIDPERYGRSDTSAIGRWFWEIDKVLLLLITVLIAIGLGMSGAGQTKFAGRPLITRPVDESSLVTLRGQQQRHPRVVPVAAAEERQPEAVVPVQVGQQDRAAERVTAEQPGDPAQPGARVEQEHRGPRVAGPRYR